MLLHCLGLVGRILGLDRKVNVAILAIDIDDHRIHLVTFLQVCADILDAVAGQLGSTQITLDVDVELDHSPLGVDRLHDAVDHAALVVTGNKVGKGIAFEVLDTERNTLTLDVDGYHHRLDLVPLLVVAHSLFAGHAP